MAINVGADLSRPANARVGDDGTVTVYDPLNPNTRFTGAVEAPPIWAPIVSVDDHMVEPPTLFDKVPARYRDAAPKMIEFDGNWGWDFGDYRRLIMAVDAGSGGAADEDRAAEAYRPGTYDVNARVADMDLAGVWASLNFPSSTFGFSGTYFAKMADRDAAIACVRAYNDWHVEDWCGAYPDRFIPCPLAYLPDPEFTASEIRRNAARGVHALSFCENPYHIGLPSLYTDFWDPVWRACADTDTVINLHAGSSGNSQRPTPESAVATMPVMLAVNSMQAIIEWIFAKIPVRYPSLKIVLTEGGASWAPAMYERLGHTFRRPQEMSSWDFSDPHPQEFYRRNFWFTSIDDPSAFRNVDAIGEDHLMLEVDYPHPDSTWPDTQAHFRKHLEQLPDETIRKLCYGTATALYHHPEPPAEWLEASVRFGSAG